MDVDWYSFLRDATMSTTLNMVSITVNGQETAATIDWLIRQSNDRSNKNPLVIYLSGITKFLMLRHSFQGEV